MSASAPVPFPPVRGTEVYPPGLYPVPAFVIVPVIPGTSKSTVAPDPVPLIVLVTIPVNTPAEYPAPATSVPSNSVIIKSPTAEDPDPPVRRIPV